MKENLKKQWAGFMYESLTKKDKVENALIQPLDAKLDRIDKNISKLFESKSIESNKLSFDLNSLIRETNIENLEQIKDKIEELLYDIRCFDYYDEDGQSQGRKVYFSKKFTPETAKLWLDSLKTLIQSFKWSKQIHSSKIFANFNLSKFNKFNNETAYKTLFELYTIYNRLNKDDKTGFYNTVAFELNKNYDEPAKRASDDLPF